MRLAPADIVEAIAAGRAEGAWWPVDRAYHEAHGTDWRDEVVIGAVLVQNTAWAQVERALANLRAHDACDLETVARMPLDRVRDAVRPTGFHQRKPATLQALARTVLAEGGCRLLAESVRDDPDPVRALLLEVHGVGPETADAILNYALDAPVFVVDAYARRLMERLGVGIERSDGTTVDPQRAAYQEVARWWRSGLRRDADTYRRAHAAIVEHGKAVCRRSPDCPVCPLVSRCATGRARTTPERNP